ncbi:MAG: NrfD/PsrC family molybdoenzyme membrane anchor subunit [Acetobacteraceae bacterium]
MAEPGLIDRIAGRAKARPVGPGADTEPHATDRYDGTTYYGRSPLKPAPFESGVVGAYIFVSGLSGAAQLITSLADLAGVRHREGLVRRGRLLSLLAPVIGAPLLIYDLHTPQRFYNMLRVAKRTSPMSIGTWILMGFSAFSGVTSALHAIGSRLLPGRFPWLKRAARWTQAPAAAAGMGLGTYTAPLLSATSTPLWAAAPKALAVQFAASAMAAGAASLSIGERHGGNKRLARDLDTLMLASLAVELGASMANDSAARAKGVSATHAARPLKAGALLGALAPFALHALAARGGRNSTMLKDAAAVAALGGSFCLRTWALRAGAESARRPGDAFRFAKPRNLPR